MRGRAAGPMSQSRIQHAQGTGLASSPHFGRLRWILTCLLLLLTLAGSAAAAQKLPRTYQSESSVLLLASRAAAKLNGGNPYLSFSPSLALTADVVSRELMAPRTIRDLAARGFPDSYTVALAAYTTQTTGSVLLVTVTGPGKADVEHTLHGVTSEVGKSLAELQSGITPYRRIRALTLSMTGEAMLAVSRTARLLVVLVGLGLAVSFGIPWMVDAELARRRNRRDGDDVTMAPSPTRPIENDHLATTPFSSHADPSARGGSDWAASRPPAATPLPRNRG